MEGVKRGYSAADVVRLRGSLQSSIHLAQRGAKVLWGKVNGGAKKGYVNAFGAITAGQAMQQAKAGLEAVYLSGWQVAADGNTSGDHVSRPVAVRLRLGADHGSPHQQYLQARRRDPVVAWHQPGDEGFIDYFLPIVADAEAGFGGVLNAFELM